MPTNPSFLHRHALPTFFALAYAITWGGILADDVEGNEQQACESAERLDAL